MKRIKLMLKLIVIILVIFVLGYLFFTIGNAKIE